MLERANAPLQRTIAHYIDRHSRIPLFLWLKAKPLPA
jgi:hypothetical protein